MSSIVSGERLRDYSSHGWRGFVMVGRCWGREMRGEDASVGSATSGNSGAPGLSGDDGDLTKVTPHTRLSQQPAHCLVTIFTATHQ